MPPGPTPVTLKFHCLGGSNSLARVTLKAPFLNHAQKFAEKPVAAAQEKPHSAFRRDHC